MRLPNLILTTLLLILITTPIIAQNHGIGLKINWLGMGYDKTEYLHPQDLVDHTNPFAFSTDLDIEGYLYSENGRYHFIALGSVFNIGNNESKYVNSNVSASSGAVWLYERYTINKGINLRAGYGFGKRIQYDRINILTGLITNYKISLNNKIEWEGFSYVNDDLREKSIGKDKYPNVHQLFMGGEVRGLYAITGKIWVGAGFQFGLYGNYQNGIQSDYIKKSIMY